MIEKEINSIDELLQYVLRDPGGQSSGRGTV